MLHAAIRLSLAKDLAVLVLFSNCGFQRHAGEGSCRLPTRQDDTTLSGQQKRRPSTVSVSQRDAAPLRRAENAGRAIPLKECARQCKNWCKKTNSLWCNLQYRASSQLLVSSGTKATRRGLCRVVEQLDHQESGLMPSGPETSIGIACKCQSEKLVAMVKLECTAGGPLGAQHVCVRQSNTLMHS